MTKTNPEVLECFGNIVEKENYNSCIDCVDYSKCLSITKVKTIQYMCENVIDRFDIHLSILSNIREEITRDE